MSNIYYKCYVYNRHKDSALCFRYQDGKYEDWDSRLIKGERKIPNFYISKDYNSWRETLTDDKVNFWTKEENIIKDILNVKELEIIDCR